MSKIVFLSPQKNSNANQGMLTFLKVMYYLGYLPFSWFSEDSPEFFKVSNWKTFFMLLYDLLLALLVPAYYYFWHIYNFGNDFDTSLLLKPSYYIGLYDGVVTTALSQIVFVACLCFAFWTFAYIGKLSA